MKKKLICALMTAAMAGSLVSGLTVSADSDSQVTISLYTTLPNKDSQFEQLCEEFMEENPDIKVNYIAYDSSEKQKWMTLYASGEAPTVSIMDPIDIQENIENMAAYDLDEDSWITDQVDESYLDVFKGEDGPMCSPFRRRKDTSLKMARSPKPWVRCSTFKILISSPFSGSSRTIIYGKHCAVKH